MRDLGDIPVEKVVNIGKVVSDIGYNKEGNNEFTHEHRLTLEGYGNNMMALKCTKCGEIIGVELGSNYELLPKMLKILDKGTSEKIVLN